MRTTLTIDDALRAGLAGGPTHQREPYHCPSFSIGALTPGVDLTKANQLAASLEDDLLIEQLRQGR